MPTDRKGPDETESRPSGPASDPGTREFIEGAPHRGEATADDRPTPTRVDQPRAAAPLMGTFGKYELLDAFPGGMGIVYKALDTKLNREVALKLLPIGPTTRPRDVDRFWREARTVARLRHDHIIAI